MSTSNKKNHTPSHKAEKSKAQYDSNRSQFQEVSSRSDNPKESIAKKGKQQKSRK